MLQKKLLVLILALHLIRAEEVVVEEGNESKPIVEEPPVAVDVPHINTVQERNDKLNEFDILLVEYYVPQCPHCKNLKPTIDKLYSEKIVNLIQVDCSNPLSNELCSSSDLKGYPTIRFYSKENQCEYQGDRKKESIEEAFFKVKKRRIETVTDFKEKDIQEFIENNKEKNFIVLKSEKLKKEPLFIDTVKKNLFCYYDTETIIYLGKVDKEEVMISGDTGKYSIDLNTFICEGCKEEEEIKAKAKKLEKLLQLNMAFETLTAFSPYGIREYFSLEVPVVFVAVKKIPEEEEKKLKDEKRKLIESQKSAEEKKEEDKKDGEENKKDENKEEKKDEEEIELEPKEKYLNYSLLESFFRKNRENRAGIPSIALFLDSSIQYHAPYVGAVGLGSEDSDENGGDIVILAEDKEKKRLNKFKLLKPVSEESLMDFFKKFEQGKLSPYFKSARIPKTENIPGTVEEVVGKTFNDFINLKKDSTSYKAAVLFSYVNNQTQENKKVTAGLKIAEEIAKIANEIDSQLKGGQRTVKVGKFDHITNEHEKIKPTGEAKFIIYKENGEEVEFKAIEEKGIDGLKELLEKEAGVKLVHVEEEVGEEL